MAVDRRWRRLHRIQQFRAGDEHHAGAGDREEHSAVARVEIELMAGPLHGSDRDRIGHQPGFRPGFDREQSTDFAQHRNH
jgi:hypothetical protein